MIDLRERVAHRLLPMVGRAAGGRVPLNLEIDQPASLFQCQWCVPVAGTPGLCVYSLCIYGEWSLELNCS